MSLHSYSDQVVPTELSWCSTMLPLASNCLHSYDTLLLLRSLGFHGTQTAFPLQAWHFHNDGTASYILHSEASDIAVHVPSISTAFALRCLCALTELCSSFYCFAPAIVRHSHCILTRMCLFCACSKFVL